MINYQKTQELFEKEVNKVPDLKYEKSGEQLSEEKWFAQVKNPNTDEFLQLEDLRAVGAVPADFRKDEKSKKYPVKKIDEIIRIKKADGTEWLTRQTWVGLDRLGNDMTKFFVDPELYDRPVFNYQSKPVNPNHEDFKNRPFDELWEWAITPRSSLDRSVKDQLQLQDRQYG
jgi:hypothetical protein